MLLFRQSGFVRLAGAAVFLLFILTTFLLHRNPDFVNWKTHIPNPGLNSSHELSHTGIKAELFYNAHQLPTADSFLPHLKAVIQLPKLTVAEAKSSCTWNKDEDIDFQYGADVEWAMEDRSDEDIELHREQWQDFINHELLPYSALKDRFQGRGIVIVGGNGKSLKRIRVILRQLKLLGSQLPVELHYWDDELPIEAQQELSRMWPKMYFNDLSAPSNIVKTSSDNFFHVNYQLKTAAVMNSRFAELLLLDSDNVPVMDPETLFESDTYKEYGTLFWPDIARTRPSNPAWPITNTQCRMDEYEQESGQLIIDKRRYFYHLQLAAWFNNVQTQYYMEFLLGDKDLFRFAWHALKTKYGFPPKWITSVGTLSPEGNYCGHTFAQHHPNGSVAFLHGGLLKTIPQAVMQWHQKTYGGIFQVYKRSVVDEQHQFIEHVNIKMDGAFYIPDRPEGMNGAWCTDMRDIAPRNFDELVPGFQKTFADLGGYWMLEDGETYNNSGPLPADSEKTVESADNAEGGE